MKSDSPLVAATRIITYLLIIVLFVRFRCFHPDPATKDCWVVPGRYSCETEIAGAWNMTYWWMNLLTFGIVTYSCALMSVIEHACWPNKYINGYLSAFVCEVLLPVVWVCSAGFSRYCMNGKTIAGVYVTKDPIDSEQSLFILPKTGRFLHFWPIMLVVFCVGTTIVAVLGKRKKKEEVSEELEERLISEEVGE